MTLAEADSRIAADIRHLPNDRLQVFLNAADVVVLPFRKTHTSGSLMLAMSFCKPVIAPAIASIPEYVDGQSGILFDPANPEALRATLVVASSKNLADMGKQAFARVANMGWTDFAASHAAVYARLTERAAAP